MRETKKEKLDAVVKLFQKEKVLKIDQFFTVFKTESRRTVHRYMKELDYLTSYSHSGKYYTLLELAEFDANGLWHYGDVGFSRHGTLLETIVYLVNRSTEGMTNNELQEKFHLVVKAALIDLVKKNKLVREKRTNRFVYLSPDLDKAQNQLQKRRELAIDSVIDDSITLRVLLMSYRLLGGSVTPEQVAISLKTEGSNISLEIVRQIFQRYEMGKKTRASTFSQS